MSQIQSKEISGNGSILEPIAPDATDQFYEMMQIREASPHPVPTPTPIPIPIPWPFFTGSRFIIWKQDPTVGALGRRLTFIPDFILNGPRNLRISTQLPGTTPVSRNVNGDFIFVNAATPEADCAHTFAVVWQTLTMYERIQGGARIPWAWNISGNTDKINVFPRAGVTANAYYSRSQKALKFFFFTPSGASSPVFTCRSFDIVSHEAGHAILDGLKPGWLGYGNPPQTGALHESFGDLSAIFLALSQLDQVEAFIAMTKANLHAKNFLAMLAEQFGAGLGRSSGLRNADNNLKLSEVTNQVHALSQVFTGGIYDVLADIFAFEKNRQRRTKDPAQVLLEVSQDLCKLLLEAINKSPSVGATYADVVNEMLRISNNQNDPAIYRTFIRNRFTFREIVVSPTPITDMAFTLGTMDWDDPDFTDKEGDVLDLEAAFTDHPSLQGDQDRSGCCGTMQLPEYIQDQDVLDSNLDKLVKSGEVIPEEDLLSHEIAELKKAFK